MAAEDPSDRDSRRHLLQGLAGLTVAGAVVLAAGEARAPARPIAASDPGVVDPRLYGARMDTVSDDSEALRRAAKSRRVILIDGPMRIDQMVDLPPETILQGTGSQYGRVVLGPQGKLRVLGESFERRVGGGVIRDLTISALDGADREGGIEMRHVEHFLFDTVTIYHVGLLLDDHHYVTFRDCQLIGVDGRTTLMSTCASQPRGRVAISEVLSFARCFFSGFPVTIEDSVGTRFTDCAIFAGPYGIRSVRRLARGSDAEPFFMGPTVSGCILDSINGPAIDIEGGGTDCRLINNFISSGRGTDAPGVRLAHSSGVEVVGNRFEWCGSAGLALDDCERIGVVANSFANIATGPGITARRSRQVRVIGNAFENRLRWGGSGAGGLTLAVEGDRDCTGWIVTANTAAGLHDTTVCRLQSGVVRDNPGWPPATEKGWAAGPSTERPGGVADGYRWYDQTLGLWLHWHRGSSRWRDPTGRAV